MGPGGNPRLLFAFKEKVLANMGVVVAMGR